MRLRSSPGIWLRAVRRQQRTARRRHGPMAWPELRFPPVNLLNAPPSPWMLRELQEEAKE
ncbi:MAG: hypothetical protein ACLFSJ_03395 [Halorhodospira sp.]